METKRPDSRGSIGRRGSFESSSIQSNQLSSFDIELEDSSIPPGTVNRNWRLGMPWFNDTVQSSPSIVASASQLEESRYYGGVMKSDPDPQKGIASHNSKRLKKSLYQKTKRALNGSSAHLRARGDDDTLADFDDSEWTPQDSSYGAACPVCGCIPKNVRRLIESSLIAGMVVAFVWMLVATSIHVTNVHKNSIQANSTENYYNPTNGINDDFSRKQGMDDDTAYNSNGDDTFSYYVDDQYPGNNAYKYNGASRRINN